MYKDNSIIHIGRRLKLNKLNSFKKFIKDIIHYRGLLRGNLISIKEISSGNISDVEILSFKNVRLYYSSPLFNDGSDRKSELREGRDYIQYAVHIKNAIIYGDSNLITLFHNQVLYDLPIYDEFKRYKYTNFNSKIITVKGNTVFYWKGITDNLEKAVWMGGNFSWNYYHLLYEFVIKFLYLNNLDISLDIPVLVDQYCLEVPQYKELIDIANRKGYRLIGVDRQRRVKVKELIYINCPNLIPPNIKNNDQVNDIQFDIKILSELRRYFLSYSSQREFPRRLFISRKNASGRRRFNEDAVMKLLSKFGFEAVFPEKMSIPDQISLFNQADWIIGGSGAAFTNILFCRNSTKIIIFSKEYFNFSGFSTIASALGIYLLYITEEDTNKKIIRGDIHDPFEINLTYLKEELINLGLKIG